MPTPIDFWELYRVDNKIHLTNSMGFFRSEEAVAEELERLNALNNGSTYYYLPRSFRD